MHPREVSNWWGFGLAALALTLAAPGAQARGEGLGYVAGAGLSSGKIDVELKRAFDLGVVDLDGDGNLDVYSTNHMFRDSFLRGDGGGSFEDAYHDVGLAPTQAVPGFEELDRAPKFEAPGIYIYMKANRKRPNIKIRTQGLDEVPGIDGSVDGRITVVFPKVKVKQEIRAKVDTRTISPRRTEVDFTTGDNARIVLRAHHIDLPFEIRVESPMPLANVYLGSQALPAPERELEVRLGDRHGVAWADFDRDGETDAYISSGGLSGNISRFRGVQSDELLLSGRKALVDRIEGAGLRKGNCRGRESLPIDFDRDSRLDLFVACREGLPMLFRGLGNGRFDERSSKISRLGRSSTAFRFVDLEGDSRPELVEARQGSVRVWRVRRSGGLAKRQVIDTRNGNKNVDGLAPGDYDNDGDLDLYVASSSGSTLLINRRGGRLSPRNPSGLGLPSGATFAANWVDYNNDSRLDLHLLPQGVYKNVGGRFRKTGIARTGKGLRFARASWFDADNDGRRDLALIAQRGTNPFPNVRYSENTGSRGRRWLELDLIGRRGNRQAIGARVKLKAGRRWLHQWVGQNEGSRYGQGHNRLYFGLGRSRVARQVTVIWPDGKRTRLGRIDSNQVRRVTR